MFNKETINTYTIAEEKDIYAITQVVQNEAKLFGFIIQDTLALANACSEILTNVIRYAKKGTVTLQPTKNHRGLELLIKDKGNGINDVNAAMKDGFTTTERSLGLGLGAAKRSVDEMLIESSKDGTVVILRIFLQIPKDILDIGVASFPKVGEHINGDIYLVKPYYRENILLGILDGSGHGEEANSSAKSIYSFLSENYTMPLPLLIKTGHKLLLENKTINRGVELALCRITPEELELVVMGNLFIEIVSDTTKSVDLQNGCLGVSIPKEINVQKIKRPNNFTVILHSDGIKKVQYDSLSLQNKSATKTAEVLFDNFVLSNDDATVIVAKGY